MINKYLYTRELLKRLSVSIRNEEIKQQLHKYYNEPSLDEYSVILKTWNIKNMIVNVPIEMLNEAPKPIMSLSNKQELFFISDINKDNFKCFFCNDSKYKTLTKDELSIIWDGICVLMETNEESGEINADIKRKEKTIFKITERLIGGGILLCIILGFFSVTENVYLYLTSVLGLSLSSYLLLRERSYFRITVLDICKFGKRFDCDKVASSDASKLFGFSLSEISTGFFLFIITSLLFSSLMNLSFHYIIPIIYLSSISVLYSIFQQIKIKTYCLFCLAISFSLCILTTLVYLKFGFKFSQFRIFDLLFTLSVTILVVGLIRNYLILNEKSKRLTSRIDSFLNSPLIAFGFADNKIESNYFENEITIGDSNAEYEIILFLNPHCKECKLILKNLSRFISEFEDQIFIRILYSGPTEDSSQSKILYANLYEFLSFLNQHELMTYLKEEHISKLKLNRDVSPELLNSLTKQSIWSNELKLDGTPAIILNNVLLPSFFGIEEVSGLLHKIKSYT